MGRPESQSRPQGRRSVCCCTHWPTGFPFLQAHNPIELLVNVDHPEDHEAWAWASYKTSGLVVPVFSNNLHEVRPGARGDV